MLYCRLKFNCLITGAILKDISNPELAEIYKEYKKEGFSSVKSKLEQVSYGSLIYEQSAPFIDNLKKTEYHLQSVKEKITKEDTFYCFYPKETVTGASTFAKEIEIIVKDSIDQCIKILSDASHEVSKRLTNKSINDAPGVGLPAYGSNNSHQDFTSEVKGDKIIFDPDDTDQIPKDPIDPESDPGNEPTV